MLDHVMIPLRAQSGPEALTVLVPAMPVYGHVATEGVLSFCVAKSGQFVFPMKQSPYRALSAEETILPAAHHP
jgi:hypothetical protein